MTTIEALTSGTDGDDETTTKIRALLGEARAAGDEAQVELCRRALAGYDDAINECLGVIAEAAAQANDASDARR